MNYKKYYLEKNELIKNELIKKIINYFKSVQNHNIEYIIDNPENLKKYLEGLTTEAIINKVFYNTNNLENLCQELLNEKLIIFEYISNLSNDKLLTFSYSILKNNALNENDLSFLIDLNINRPNILMIIASHSSLTKKQFDFLFDLKNEKIYPGLVNSTLIDSNQLKDILKNIKDFNILKIIFEHQNLKNKTLKEYAKLYKEFLNEYELTTKEIIHYKNLIKIIEEELNIRKLQKDGIPYFNKKNFLNIDISEPNITLNNLLEISENEITEIQNEFIKKYLKYLKIKKIKTDEKILKPETELFTMNMYIENLNIIEKTIKDINNYFIINLKDNVKENVLISKEAIEDDFTFL